MADALKNIKQFIEIVLETYEKIPNSERNKSSAGALSKKGALALTCSELVSCESVSLYYRSREIIRFLAATEGSKLARLFERYGISDATGGLGGLRGP